MSLDEHAIDYGTTTRRRLGLRPAVAIIAIICISLGITGLVVAQRNFTFPAQDSDQMPPVLALDRDLKQPWLDFSGSLLLIGVAGLVLSPFAFRLKTVARKFPAG